jgi:DNA-binding LacI/PurR family transcriptional regulator
MDSIAGGNAVRLDRKAGMGKRPTLEDVAARAGVSRALVSIVIRGAPGASPQTRERVLRAVEELQYRPDATARLLARQRSRLLGVMFNVHHAFHADLVEGIYGAAEPFAYDVVLTAVTPGRNEQRAIETLLDSRCEALILLGPEVSGSWLAGLTQRLPVVAVGRQVREPSVDVVRNSDDEGMRQAVEHLVSLGHQDIRHVDGGRNPKSAERRRGYRAAMRRRGLAEFARVVPGGQTEASGGVAARRLLAEGSLPTAVLAYNDDCALGLLDAFARDGVAVPRDISVAGYDDSQLGRRAHINLTTVGQDAQRMASLAVKRAVARMAGDKVAERELVLSPHLVVRGTTAAPRAPSRRRKPNSK